VSREHALGQIEYASRLFRMTPEELRAETLRHEALGYASLTPAADPSPVAAHDDRPAGSLVAYTDGSGTQAHLVCGAGVVIYDGDEAVLEASRHLGLGTNNHAELSGVRIALAITDTPAWRAREIVIRSDSEYAIGAMTSPRGPRPGAANERLILATRRLLAGRTVRFEHVKGHSGVEGNERADHLAGLARKRTPKPAERSAA
jgi:ribonuclease HI